MSYIWISHNRISRYVFCSFHLSKKSLNLLAFFQWIWDTVCCESLWTLWIGFCCFLGFSGYVVVYLLLNWILYMLYYYCCWYVYTKCFLYNLKKKKTQNNIFLFRNWTLVYLSQGWAGRQNRHSLTHLFVFSFSV